MPSGNTLAACRDATGSPPKRRSATAKPVIRGLRYPVQMLLELLASGMSIEEVLAD